MLIEITDKNYSKLIENTDKPFFLDFYSPSCGPCQELLPFLENLNEYGKDEIIIGKIDVSKNPKLAKKYQIESVPFCCTIDKEKRIKDFESGLSSTDRYLKMVDKVLGKEGTFKKIFKKFYI